MPPYPEAVAEQQQRSGPWPALGQAGLVAGLALAAVLPYVYYLSHVALPRGLPLPVERLLEADLALTGVLVLICSLAGALLARRYGLVGLGDLTRLRGAAPQILGWGVTLCAGSYLALGRPLARVAPGSYPSSLGWALLFPFKGALFDETVARFGMMTIICGVVRRPLAASLLQAVFFAAITVKNLSFHGVHLPWGALLAAVLLTALVVHFVQGMVYARHGLLAAAALHWVVDLKYVVHALL